MHAWSSRFRALCGVMVLGIPAAFAQSYPVKPVRLVVGIAPGGGLDASTRIVANGLSKHLNQQVVVENRAGAGGTIAAASVAGAAPDGYTLLYGTTSLLAAQAMYDNLSFDPVKSFTPVAGTLFEPLVLGLHPAVAAKNITEFIALVRANPGKLSYGSPGVGTVHHLAMESFNTETGLRIVHIPYKGAAAYVPDLVAGVLPVAVISVTAALPHSKSGKVRVIAITSEKRLPLAPDWTPLADILPGFDMASIQFVLGPAGMPAAIVNRLSDAVRAAVSMEEARKAFEATGGTADWSAPEVLAARIREGVVKWGGIARQSGAKGQ
jgi:tripartite-type tricarboxylate transporter receptor subunit TctC